MPSSSKKKNTGSSKNTRSNTKRNTAPVVEEETVLAAETQPEEEEDVSDEDVETDEEEEEAETAGPTAAASTGEPKAKKTRGPRKILYVLSANIMTAADEVKLQTERIIPKAAAIQPFDRKKGEAEARLTFRTKHGTEAESCEGPFYIVRDPSATTGKKRETLNMSIGAQYGFNGEMGTAVHKGWSCIVNFTHNKDYVMVMYDKIVNPVEAGQKEGKKLQKPNPRYVPISAIRELHKTTPVAN